MTTSVHPSAVIHPSAELGEGVEVGPYVVIEERERIGEGSRLLAHAFVGRNTVLGKENVLHVGAVLGHAPQDLSTTGDEDARLVAGDRNTFREYTTLHRGSRDGTETSLGDDNFIMSTAHVAHDCKLGSRVIMASGALLAGHVTIEDRAFISGNAAIHQFCRIGTMAMVSGLSRVSKDVHPYLLLKGDSLIYGVNSVGLQRAGLSEQQRNAVRRAYKILYRKGLRLDAALRRIEESLSDSPHARHFVEFVRGSQRGISPHHRRGAPKT
jgi:UDP-N-acetylglucosamine acyltransferase